MKDVIGSDNVAVPATDTAAPVARIGGRGNAYTDDERRRIIEQVKLAMQEGFAEHEACKLAGIASITYTEWTSGQRQLSELSTAEREELSAKAREMYMAGKTIREIATTLNVSYQAVRGWSITGVWRDEYIAATGFPRPGGPGNRKKKLKKKAHALAKKMFLSEELPVAPSSLPAVETFEIPHEENRTPTNGGNGNQTPFVMLIGSSDDINRALDNLSAIFQKR